MNTKTKFPTTHVVHWATGPVECCEEHANGLVKLGQFLGSHVPISLSTNPDAECSNCIDESK